MQLRALIELSGYCETRNPFLRCCINMFHSSPCNKNFLKNILSRICGTEYSDEG